MKRVDAIASSTISSASKSSSEAVGRRIMRKGDEAVKANSGSLFWARAAVHVVIHVATSRKSKEALCRIAMVKGSALINYDAFGGMKDPLSYTRVFVVTPNRNHMAEKEVIIDSRVDYLQSCGDPAIFCTCCASLTHCQTSDGAKKWQIFHAVTRAKNLLKEKEKKGKEKKKEKEKREKRKESFPICITSLIEGGRYR